MVDVMMESFGFVGLLIAGIVLSWFALSGWVEAWHRGEQRYAKAAWDLQMKYPLLDSLAVKLYAQYLAYDEAHPEETDDARLPS